MAIENDQIFDLWPVVGTIGKLQKATTRTHTAIRQLTVEKIFGITECVGHFMMKSLVIIAFNKLYALVLHTNIIARICYISFSRMADHPIVVHLYAMKAIDRFPNRIF